MKNVFLAEPSTLALLGLGFFLLCFGVVAVLGTVAFMTIFLTRKARKENPPASQPTLSTQAPPKTCPKCGTSMPPDSPEGLCPRCLIAVNLATQTDIPGEPGAAKVPPGPPAPVADVAKLFPQLEILECLGRGGMGAVYKVRQPRLDRVVALKILSPEKQGNQKFAERFEREARALAKLHHPNIVTVFDFGEVEGNFYLLMEFVDGLSLRQLLQQRKLSPPEALAIVPKICEALQYAHQQGIVHRDIKPENILMDKDGRVKIADFGIAKILGDGGGSNLTAEQVIGTPHYMSPEQIEKPQAVDHRADIYSLGVVFYEMLTGELPLGKFPPPSKKVQVDVRLDEIVLRALEKEPERRYQQASEVKTEVETVAATAPGAAPAQTGKSSHPAFPAGKSGLVRIVELFFDITFQSRWAIRLVNFSALGFLGWLGFLGYLPGMQPFFAFFGFTGFFGLIGAAIIVELVVRRKSSGTTAGQKSGQKNGNPLTRVKPKTLILGLAIIVLTWMAGILFLAFGSGKSAYIGFQLLPIVLFIVLPGMIIYFVWRAREHGTKRPLDNTLRFAILTLIALFFITLVVFFVTRPAWQHGKDDLAEVPSVSTPLTVNSQIGNSDYYSGQTWFPYGDSIEIKSVDRTDNQITVKGRYHLVSADRAALRLSVFWAIQTNWDIRQPEKEIEISRGTQNFEITDSHLLPGWGFPRISMCFTDDTSFGEVAFGTEAEEKYFQGQAPQTKTPGSVEEREINEIASNFPAAPDFSTPENACAALYRAEAREDLPAINRIVAYRFDPKQYTDWFQREKERDAEGMAVYGKAKIAKVQTWNGTIANVIAYLPFPAETRRPRYDANYFGFVNGEWKYIGSGGRWPHLLTARANFYRDSTKKMLPYLLSHANAIIGQTWFPYGDSIDIDLVYRTNNEISVEGRYHLVSHNAAALNLYFATTNSDSPQNPEQSITIPGGTGDFHLTDTHVVPGLPHVSMYADGHPFASVYFGTRAEADEESKAAWITNTPSASTQMASSPADDDSVLAEQPPVVVETFPLSGARDVAPGDTEIRVRFSKDMIDGDWSWSTAWENSTPESVGPPHYLDDHRTCVMEVHLEPGRTYGWWLNSDKFLNFKDASGQPAVPYLFSFQTKQTPAATNSASPPKQY
jgi:hypothetical protein